MKSLVFSQNNDLSKRMVWTKSSAEYQGQRVKDHQTVYRNSRDPYPRHSDELDLIKTITQHWPSSVLIGSWWWMIYFSVYQRRNWTLSGEDNIIWKHYCSFVPNKMKIFDMRWSKTIWLVTNREKVDNWSIPHSDSEFEVSRHELQDNYG